MKNPNRMSLEELRTLELPVTLECDDGDFIYSLKKIEVTAVGKQNFLYVDGNGMEKVHHKSILKHYPSLKKTPRYETLYECIGGLGASVWTNSNGHRPLFGRNKFSRGVYPEVLKRRSGRTVNLNIDT